jgi:hypothetical protein
MAIKKLLLLLLILPLVLSIQSCGKGAGEGYTPPGSGPGDPVYVKLKPARNAAQTNGCIDFYAEVHDAQGELLANIPVTFTNMSEPLGVILDRCGGIEIYTPVTTDGWGRAKITIMSTTPGFVTVLAQTNLGAQPRDRKTVLFSNCDTYDCLVLAPSVQLDADSEPPDGIYNEPEDFIIFDPLALPDDKANLLATVRNEYGVPIPFQAHVVWGADHTEAAFTRTEAWTNENGQAAAQVEFTPSSLRLTETHVNVWAYSDNVSSFFTPFGIVTFFLQPVFISSIDVSADPSVVAPVESSTITATVWLNTGDLAPDGVPVTFTTCDAATCTVPCGAVDPFSQTIGGEATAQFIAPPIPNTCRVNAWANGVTGFVDILVTTELTVTPDSIDVNGTVGGTATFTVFGGVAPYTVISDSVDPNLQPVPTSVANSGDTFVVTVPAGTPDATVTYTIRDARGDEVTADVVITGDALAVFPADATIDGSVAGVSIATYTIFGGVPPYDIFSSDPLYPPVPTPVANSGDTFAVTVVTPTPPVTVTYTIRDSVGTTTTATLSITGVTTPLAVNPVSGTFSCTAGGTLTFFPSGGVQPYSSISLDPTATITTNDALMPTSFDVIFPAGTCAPTFPLGNTVVNVILQDSNTPTGTVTIPITVTNP